MKTAQTWKRIMEWAVLGLILIALIVIFAGCTKTRQILVREPLSPSPGLKGRWDLASYGPAGSERRVLDDTQVFITFTGDGKISGSGGCNRYFGGWGFLEGAKGTLRIWRTGSTRMACSEHIMTQEYRFLEELSRVSAYAIETAELRLYYDEGRGILRFSRGSNP